MNLSILKKTCAAYHGKKVSELTDPDTNQDLFLVAVNNARKEAERAHAFEDCWCLATLTVAHTTGGALADAIIAPPDIFSGIREIISVAGTINGCKSPLTIKRPNQGPARLVPRYPTDGQAVSCGCNYLIIRGGYLYQFPDLTGTTDLAVEIEAYGWLNDYVDDDLQESADVPDFLVEHGFTWLQWACIIELNYKFQTFVFRQEGNPGAPEKLKQAAWDSLIAWDSYRISPHTTDER